ncbi:MAG: DUF1080 domain-containing protein [Planctomycetaceae bacterium]|jgi:hypothetical protein|nr:DUF1080 domain-containing protein [Planctomycetaceae bacterium]MDG2389777.1 DUF1080 domain-containing protein [Planctomycetaceae bacterium]
MKQSLTIFTLFLFLLPGCVQEEPSSSPTSPTVTPASNTPETPAKKETPKQPAVKPIIVDEPETIPDLLPAEEYTTGWIRLFDGYTLFGWEQLHAAKWNVSAEGVLTSPADADPSILMTTVPWTDFELQLDYKLADGGNSGIFLRTSPSPSNPAVDCYELNLCDTHEKFKTGSLVTRAQPIAEVTGDGGWHTLRVICDGNWIQAWLDDVHMTDFHDESEKPLLSGRIGLQQNGGMVEFKNVKLKPFSTNALFAGESLDQWSVVPGSKSTFDIVEETIHVADGPGFLETKETFADFVLQADYNINGDGLNSGIFFRAMKGTEDAPSHGYECQVHNAYENGDPRQPTDHGSGGIFKRVEARRVVSKDREWNTITLNASGNHFATWVNGYQTADWMDTRERDENPRKGRRDKAGHISLQGHDPTTDLNYREIKITPHAE